MSGMVIDGLQRAILVALKNAPRHRMGAVELDLKLGGRHTAIEMLTALVRLHEGDAVDEAAPLTYRLTDNGRRLLAGGGEV